MEKKFSEKMKNKFFERKIIIFDTISITCYLSFLIRSIFQTVGCKKKKKKKPEIHVILDIKHKCLFDYSIVIYSSYKIHPIHRLSHWEINGNVNLWWSLPLMRSNHQINK
jgi:hypothetical protein